MKHLGLDIKVADASGDETFEKNFPLKKIPAFIGADGFTLNESIAVNLYCKFCTVFFSGPKFENDELFYLLVIPVLKTVWRTWYLIPRIIGVP